MDALHCNTRSVYIHTQKSHVGTTVGHYGTKIYIEDLMLMMWLRMIQVFNKIIPG